MRGWEVGETEGRGTPPPFHNVVNICKFPFLFTLSATSDGTSISLSNHEGGHCASSNMKMTIYICSGSSGENLKVKR